MSNTLANKKSSTTYALVVGLLFLLALMVLSGLYWRERVLFSDAAYQVFYLINGESFAIQLQRYGAWLVQWPALMMVKLGVPLPEVLLTFSLSYTLYPLLFVLLIWRGLKQPILALLAVFFYLLTQVHTFFWIQSELIIGCMYGILTMAFVLHSPRPAWWRFVLWQFLLLLIAYSHPLSPLPFLYLWAWYGWRKRKALGLHYWSLPLSVFLILVFKFFIGTVSSYDVQAIDQTDGILSRMFHFFYLESTAFFFERLWSTYYILAACFLLVTIVTVRQKLWIHLGLMLSAIGAWLLLVLSTYHTVTDQAYLESYFLPLGIFVGLPFLHYIFSRLSAPTGLLVVLGLTVFRLVQITEARNYYERRQDWVGTTLTEAAERYPGQRYYILREDVPPQFLKMEWAIAFETLLRTSLDGPRETKMLNIIYADQETTLLELKEAFPAGWWGIHKYTWMNKDYFEFHDTTLPQRIEK